MHPHTGSKALGIQVNPIDGYQCSNEFRAHLNLTRQPKRSDHTWKACPIAFLLKCHGMETAAVSLLNERRRLLARLQTTQCQSKENGEASHSGQLFNHTTIDRVKIEKWPAVSLFLNELLIQKCQFQRSFQSVNSLLRQAFLEGFMPP